MDMTGWLPAVPLSRLPVGKPLKGMDIETGNFASPSRGGFALFVVDDCACTWAHNRITGLSAGQRET